MDFQTKIPLQSQPDYQIDYNSRIVLLGSCFAQHIGDKLSYYKFQVSTNPFGILFHSSAIENLVLRALNREDFTMDDLDYLNERWFTFEAHSQWCNASQTELLSQLNLALLQTRENLLNASHVVITLGTAWVYRLIERSMIVANCHKVPQNEFLKTLLSIDEIKQNLIKIRKQIRLINPKVQFIYTVSPVRHLKDGFVENTQSKSHLISAIHECLDSNTNYFPAYEIMMDELRDYRFYSKDMIHPNSTAIDHIWERFMEVWVKKEVFETISEVGSIQKGLLHKPFNTDSKLHHLFTANLEEKKKKLITQFPHMRF